MLGLSEETIRPLNSQKIFLQSYASCLFGLVWLRSLFLIYLSPKTSPNQKSILVLQTPPTNGIWSSHYQRSLQELETELMQVDHPDHRHALCPHSRFSCATLILNALMLFRKPTSCSWTISCQRSDLVIATTECQQQRLTPSPIMLGPFRPCPRYWSFA